MMMVLKTCHDALYFVTLMQMFLLLDGIVLERLLR